MRADHETRQRWVFIGAHAYRMECSMPGALYYAEEDICRVDEDTLGIPTLSTAVEVDA